MSESQDNRGNRTLTLNAARHSDFDGNRAPSAGYQGKNPRSDFNRRPPSGNNRDFPRKPQGPKGHDVQLKDAQDNGRPVTVTLMSGGEEVNGIITNRDRYTITIGWGAPVRSVIIYKHAIEMLQVTYPTEVQPVAAAS